MRWRILLIDSGKNHNQQRTIRSRQVTLSAFSQPEEVPLIHWLSDCAAALV